MEETQENAASRPPVAWWETLHWMSMEAPLLAVLWLAGMAGAHGLRLMPEVYAGLGLLVWAVYLTDRWIDARHWPKEEPWTARHRFCLEHSRILIGVALPLIAGTVAWLALCRVPGILLGQCAVVAILTCGYLVWMRMLKAAPGGGREEVKSIVAAALFAVGVGIGVHAHEYRYPKWAVFAGQGLLTGLFLVNLTALSQAEREKRGAGGVAGKGWFWQAAAVTCMGALAVWTPWVEPARPLRLLGLAVLVSTGLTVCVHALRGRLTERAHRVWVDAATGAGAGFLIWLGL